MEGHRPGKPQSPSAVHRRHLQHFVARRQQQRQQVCRPTSTAMPNTHRRRDSAVELSRVGGVNAPVGSREFTISCAIEVGDK